MCELIRLTLSILFLALCGCTKAPEPPTAEAVDAFTEAAYMGNTAAVSSALKNGMPVDQVETNGNSALMLAAFNGKTETMKALLDAGATVDLRDRNERTALMFASTGPFPAAVRLLLEHDADVNAIDGDEHWTPVMFAASEGLSPIVDLLLQHGADPGMLDIDGESAADFARSRGFPALADKLQALIDQKDTK